MNINDKQSAIIAMNDLFYYAMNIPYEQITYKNYQNEVVSKWVPKFIKNVEWPCDVQHMIEIWENAVEDGGYWGSYMCFYSKLDNTCRRKLNEYIIDNYNSGSNI